MPSRLEDININDLIKRGIIGHSGVDPAETVDVNPFMFFRGEATQQ